MLLLLLFSFILCQCEGTVYVFHSSDIGVVVATFTDAVSEFGPEFFHLDGYFEEVSPSDACRKLFSPVVDGERTSRWSNTLKVDDAANKLPYVALVESGGCDFDQKVFNAQTAGYSAVIVMNSVDDEVFPMSGTTYVDQIIIPSVMVDRAAGKKLLHYAQLYKPTDYLISMVSFYRLPLKYVLFSLLLVVGVSLVVLVVSFCIHLCRLCRYARRGRLSKRHLRRLATQRFIKGRDPYDTCAICLEDYQNGDRLRLLPCQHAFHIDCIDTWLLQNQRRCPVCNQVVELYDAPRLPIQDADGIPTHETTRPRFLPFVTLGTRVRLGINRILSGRNRTPVLADPSASVDDEEAPLLDQTQSIDGFAQSNQLASGSQQEDVNSPCTPVEADTLVDLNASSSLVTVRPVDDELLLALPMEEVTDAGAPVNLVSTQSINASATMACDLPQPDLPQQDAAHLTDTASSCT